MSDYSLEFTTGMARDYKRVKKQGKDMGKLQSALAMLCAGTPLPAAYNDHALTGRWRGARDCHIEPDWVLIYQIDKGRLILQALATGSHSDLF